MMDSEMTKFKSIDNEIEKAKKNIARLGSIINE